MSDLSWSVMILLFVSCLTASDAFERGTGIEERGKKDKIAVYVYFLDLIVKKLFILKLVYAAVSWLVLHKAGYFLAWVVASLQHTPHRQHHAPHYHTPYRKTNGPYRKDRYGS